MRLRFVLSVLVAGSVAVSAAGGTAVWGDGIADLIYLPETGEVILWPEDAPGGIVLNYVLQREDEEDGFRYENADFPDGKTSGDVGALAIDTEVSWTDVGYVEDGDQPSLAGTFNSGAILPAGLTEAELADWFSRSTFVGLPGTGEWGWNLSHGYAHITNDVTMSIVEGAKTVGSISGGGTLSIADGASVQLQQQASPWAATNVQDSLSISAAGSTGGTLDVTNNVITFADGDEAEILALVVNAYNEGDWDQPGITSSSLTAGYAVGVADTADGVKVGYTLQGDATMSGSVGSGDLALLGANYGVSEDATWAMGDFTYSRSVGSGDLALLGANYGGDILSSSSAEAMTVPEPATLSLLAIGGVAMLKRRGQLRIAD